VTRFATVFGEGIAVQESKDAARAGLFFHRLFDRVNIRACCAFEPCGVHAQHYLNAMAMLLRDPEQILSTGDQSRRIFMNLLISSGVCVGSNPTLSATQFSSVSET
jgi:hypothetical protein